MAKVLIDGRPFETDENKNLLESCLSAGIDLPYFCWHPTMGSVGACRQCAVKQFKDDEDTRGKLVMACMTPASDGTRISVDDPEAKAFRASVVEWLMLNHPHDCPVCDEGGECHLQDMTVMTGHTHRRSRFPKRTFRNQDLGPFINHEMNRCIECYRCVRFYREYAGGTDLDVFGAHDHVYFGRHQDGVLESEFSGNLVEICPTGVFTDKTFKHHFTRKWDLRTAPSVCTHCGLGCNVIPGERSGALRRIRNRYNHEVNGYFLCDRGRFGYEFVNSALRLRHASRRANGSSGRERVARDVATRHVASLLDGKGGVVGIGSPRASLEANYALRRLVGEDSFYMGVSRADKQKLDTVVDILQRGPAGSASIHDVESSDAALVLGEDVTGTAPRLALALRQLHEGMAKKLAADTKIPEWHAAAVREVGQAAKAPLYVVAAHETRLDDAARETYRAAPPDIARLGYAIAHLIDRRAAAVDGLTEPETARAERIARQLESAERPVIVSGTGLGEASVLTAAAQVAWALYAKGKPARLALAVPECNSVGASLLGGKDLEEAFARAEKGAVEVVIVVENDLYRRAPGPRVDEFLARAGEVVVIDYLEHPTSKRADVFLPSGSFAESDGTWVNNEGRAQRFFQVFAPEEEIRESWRCLRDLLVEGGDERAAAWHGLDDVIAALVETYPGLARVRDAAPSASLRLLGQRVPREPNRHSGRTAATANVQIHEPEPPEDLDAPLSFSMEGYRKQPPPALLPFFWAPGWNSVQAVNKFQDEIGGALRGEAGGRRLIEPPSDQPPDYYTQLPMPFSTPDGELYVIPLHHLFGSEELSVLAPAIAGQSPEPYVALSIDASKLLDDVAPGDAVEISVGGVRHRLPVKVMASLPAGTAALPVGIDPLIGVALPDWGRVARKTP